MNNQKLYDEVYLHIQELKKRGVNYDDVIDAIEHEEYLELPYKDLMEIRHEIYKKTYITKRQQE